jgi:hypothetical protein
VVDEFLRVPGVRDCGRRAIPRLSKKLRVLVAWTLDLLFGKDIEQLVTVRDVEAVTRDGPLTGRVVS